MDRKKITKQEFAGSVGQVAGGNIINIHHAPEQPDYEVIRAVAELLALANANELLDTMQNISQALYGSTHFKALKLWQLRKLIAVAQEVIGVRNAVKAARVPFWRRWFIR